MKDRCRFRRTLLVAVILVFISFTGCVLVEGTRSKESVLKEDLYSLRTCIDQYRQDKQKAPQDLNELVTAGYLRTVPQDPFTKTSETWRLDREKGRGGIVDIHSGSNQISTEGTRYSDW